MNDDTIAQTVLFPDLVRKPLVAAFDQAHASSDGGAILLKAADRQLQLTTRLAACLVDDRDPARVTHALQDVVAQRLFGIACGYPDANDSDRLAEDPIQKLLLGRDPVHGQTLASQLHRNGGPLTMGDALAELLADITEAARTIGTLLQTTTGRP